MNISTIENYMTKWNQYTYRQGIMFMFMPKKDREKCLWVMDELGILDKKMTGESVQGLLNIDEGFAGGIYFTEVFEKWANGKFLSPASFILCLIREYEMTGLPFDGNIIGTVGRGLRGLPSFIREIDLADKLKLTLPNSSCIRTRAIEDMKDHTDVRLEYNGIFYRVFSYQNTGHSLKNMVSKILGERGSTPNGHCLLCPFNYLSKDYAKDVYGWRLHNERYLQKVKEILDSYQPLQYANLSRKSFSEISQIVKNICIIYK